MKHAKWYYLGLLFLSLGVLGVLSAYLATKLNALLITLLSLFAVYLLYAGAGAAFSKKLSNRQKEDISAFCMEIAEERYPYLYLDIYCKDKQVLLPRENKCDFFVSLYEAGNEEEIEADALHSGDKSSDSFAVPYTSLKSVRGKHVLLSEELYALLKQSKLYSEFLARNKFLPHKEKDRD